MIEVAIAFGGVHASQHDLAEGGGVGCLVDTKIEQFDLRVLGAVIHVGEDDVVTPIRREVGRRPKPPMQRCHFASDRRRQANLTVQRDSEPVKPIAELVSLLGPQMDHVIAFHQRPENPIDGGHGYRERLGDFLRRGAATLGNQLKNGESLGDDLGSGLGCSGRPRCALRRRDTIGNHTSIVLSGLPVLTAIRNC